MHIEQGSCPREQMMVSNVSILDTEAAQVIVLLGIEGARQRQKDQCA